MQFFPKSFQPAGPEGDLVAQTLTVTGQEVEVRVYIGILVLGVEGLYCSKTNQFHLFGLNGYLKFINSELELYD